MLLIRTADGPVRTVAYSGDGTLLAWAGRDNNVYLRDLAAAAERAVLQGHTYPVRSLAFFPDGRTLASGSWDHTVRLWDTADGRQVVALRHRRGVNSIGCVSGGKLLLSGTSQKLYFWNVAATKCQGTIAGGRGPITFACAPDDDGRTLLVAGGWLTGSSVGLLDVSASRTELLTRERARVRAVAFSPGGCILATAAGWTVKLWDRYSRRLLASCKSRRPVNGIAFTPDGRTLLTAGEDRLVRVWDAATGSAVTAFDWGAGRLYSLAVSPDGLTAAAGGEGCVAVWDTDSA
jgi:WD40 repeat protein